MKHASKISLLALCMLLLSACSDKAVYTQERFANDSPFRMKVDGDVVAACESARRSLLGQGYLIESADSEKVKGRKAYRSEGNLNTFIEMNVVCVTESKGSSLFASGVLSTYDLKKSSSAASVGLSALGSISLPIGQSADSLVKIGEETISDAQFYNRFFSAVQYTLGETQAGRAAQAAAVPQEPEPAASPGAQPPAPEAAASAGAQPPAPEAAASAAAQPPAPEAAASPGAQPPAPEPGPTQSVQPAPTEVAPVQPVPPIAPAAARDPPAPPAATEVVPRQQDPAPLAEPAAASTPAAPASEVEPQPAAAPADPALVTEPLAAPATTSP
jgi:Uncharacterized protein conserved in bacteria (DUF2242)